jgi:hypothetical protein
MKEKQKWTLEEVCEYLKDAIRYSPGADESDWFDSDKGLIAAGRKTPHKKWVTVFATEDRASTVFENGNAADELFTLGQVVKR